MTMALARSAQPGTASGDRPRTATPGTGDTPSIAGVPRTDSSTTGTSGAEGVSAEHGREHGRQRVRNRTDRKLIDATMNIALNRGVEAVTIEEVSRISGVAKTTIYRRFHNRQELLEGIANSDMLKPPDTSHTSFDIDGIAELISAAVTEFDEAFGVKAVGQVMSSDSRFFHSMVDNFLMPVRGRIADYFRRGAAAHQFRADLDLDFILDLTLGGMVATAALHDGVPADWPRRTAEFLWPHLVAGGANTPPASPRDSKPDGSPPDSNPPSGAAPSGTAPSDAIPHSSPSVSPKNTNPKNTDAKNTNTESISAENTSEEGNHDPQHNA